MLQIRENIFETNSSSSHSLVYSNRNRGYSYDLPVDECGVLTIPFGEYGWGPDLLKTPIQKLSYLITTYSNYSYLDSKMSWNEIINDVLKQPKIKEILDIVREKCPQIKEFQFESASSYYPRGYIDHESVGTADEDNISEVIFNNDILIVIDNDNSCRFGNYTGWGCDVKKEDLFDLEIDDLEKCEQWY